MIKRLLDIIFSIIVFLSLSPVFFIISIIIFIVDGRPVFFKQNRSGINKKTFVFYKFKTMKHDNGKFEEVLKDDDRITPFGRLLRKTSLDELPSFINVLKGDMSVVGPRPLLERYLPRYDNYQIRRLEVKPGITGLAQIKGRNSLSWRKKFKYDTYYVDNHNMCLDLKILIKTVFLVLRFKGITPTNQEIMPEFIETEKNEPAKEY